MAVKGKSLVILNEFATFAGLRDRADGVKSPGESPDKQLDYTVIDLLGDSVCE